MNQALKSPITTLALVAFVVVLAIHVAAVQTETWRFDLTENDLYSLSEGSEEILTKMRSEGVEPVRMTLYFSETVGKTLPRFIKDFITYRDYVESLLREYEVAAGGKLAVDVVDPTPDSDAAQNAQDYGLDGRPVNQHGDMFFFGLVFETRTGSRDVIEFLWPNQQETVEYEITKTLYNLLWPSQKRIGVLSSLEVLGSGDNPYMAQILRAQGKQPVETWIAFELLRESYEVSTIDADTDRISPDDFDLLIVVHPKALGVRAQWAVDEWIQRGGNALVFIDPFAIQDQAPQDPQNPLQAYQYDASSDLPGLLRAWGLERPAHRVAADFDLALKRATRMGGPAERLVVDLQIDETDAEATLDRTHPVLQGLVDLRFFTPGVLRQTGDTPEGVTLEPLVTTTDGAAALTMRPGFPGGRELTFLSINQPAALQDELERVLTEAERSGSGSDAGGDEELIVGDLALAYMVRGKLPSAFPNGADLPGGTPAPPPGLPPGVQLPPPDGPTTRVEAVPAEERAESTVLVFADVDFISDPLAFQNTILGAVAQGDNYKILLNGVDYLFGSQELTKVRANKSIRRPFTLFDEIEEEADAASLERESALRAEIEQFQEELRDKQSTAGNVALLKKQVQDEVDDLNRRIREADRELREIRKDKRSALEGEEYRVRFAVMGAMPLLVFLLGMTLFVRRRLQMRQARRFAG
ncbi:MAG: Gldg family protein [Thermoanaerobaculia bacterium]|nr:Gldg family protein [Thermoanaerobaculia bacterium]